MSKPLTEKQVRKLHGKYRDSREGRGGAIFELSAGWLEQADRVRALEAERDRLLGALASMPCTGDISDCANHPHACGLKAACASRDVAESRKPPCFEYRPSRCGTCETCQAWVALEEER